MHHGPTRSPNNFGRKAILEKQTSSFVNRRHKAQQIWRGMKRRRTPYVYFVKTTSSQFPEIVPIKIAPAVLAWSTIPPAALLCASYIVQVRLVVTKTLMFYDELNIQNR